MSHRKAFNAEYGSYVIVDEFAQEVYIGITTLSAMREEVEAERKWKRERAKLLRGILFASAFSAGMLILGLVIAKLCR